MALWLLMTDFSLDANFVCIPGEAIRLLENCGNRKCAVISESDEFIAEVRRLSDFSCIPVLEAWTVRDVAEAAVAGKVLLVYGDPKGIFDDSGQEEAGSTVLRWFAPCVVKVPSAPEEWVRKLFEHICFAFFKGEQEEQEFVARILVEGGHCDRFFHTIEFRSHAEPSQYERLIMRHYVSSASEAWKAFWYAVGRLYGGGVIVVRNPVDPLSAVLPLAAALTGSVLCGLVIVTCVDGRGGGPVGFSLWGDN